jgi:hypothetical protein
MIIKENRTVSYIGTVDLSNDEDMSLVKGIRSLVKEANKKQAFGKRPMYVKLQGRGPRLGIRRYNDSLPLTLSKTADVYLYARYQ